MPSRCMMSAWLAPVSTRIGSFPPRIRKPNVGIFVRTPMLRPSTRKLDSMSMSMRLKSLISRATGNSFLSDRGSVNTPFCRALSTTSACGGGRAREVHRRHVRVAVTELERPIELLQRGLRQRQFERVARFEHEREVLPRVPQRERRRKLALQDHLALEVRVGHVHRTVLDDLEERARIEVERLGQRERLAEVLDRAQDPGVYHELQPRA